MATIFPFRAWRYSPEAGPLDLLATQPYDKITPAMQARYLELSPYNAVRMVLGPRSPADTAADNVYTRARRYLDEWTSAGVLVQKPEPCFYAYFQEFTDPDTGERLLRQGLIGLGAVENYSAGVVHRHEQTLSGPKQDRLELLRHCHAHFGHIFMLYPDQAGAVDALLTEAAQAPPDASLLDDYQTRHTLWRIAAPERIARIQQLMAGMKLLIADGHHRYETALAFRRESPAVAGADRVMMTFINLHSPGLRILATHRVVSGLAGIEAEELARRAAEAGFSVRPLPALDALRAAWAEPHPDRVLIGAAVVGSEAILLLEGERPAGELHLKILHAKLLGEALGISEQAVRQEQHIRYIRGLDAALNEVREGGAQMAFLVEPTPIGEVARVAFSGGVMPQKSTDFYPKLLSGLTICRL
jgi:uncharacterized protein (DUF1015 family)